MKKVFILLLAALALSCQVEQQTVVEEPELAQEEENLVYKTFTVSMPGSPIDPETKTTLHSDGHAVYWSAGDEIAVIEVANAVKRTFTLKSGAGTASAVFEGSVSADARGYYAYYPNVDIKTASLPDYIEPNAALSSVQRPVVGGFDSNFGIMTAVDDGTGNFAFRHGVAYFKLTIARDDVTSVKLSTSGSRFNGRPQYIAASGVTNAINSASSDMVLAPVSGNLTQGATYYIPVLYKNSNTGSLTLEYTFSNGSTSSKVSTSLNKVKLEAGKIYNLGTPSIVPAPRVSASNQDIDGDSTSGSLSFTVLNPTGDGVMTAEVTDSSPADWLTLGAVDVSSVAYTCPANTTGSPKTATVKFTYTYDTDKTAIKEITVTNTVPGVVSYNWDFSSASWTTKITAEFTAKDTNQSDIDFSFDDLRVTGGGNSMKYNYSGEVYWIQTGGAGGASSRRFEYTAPKAGTITVYFSNTGNGNSSRYIKVKDTSEEHSGSVTTTNTDQVSESFSVSAGLVQIYPTNGMRFYKITFESD